MDPYLERPNLWPNFHNTFISVARDQLVPRLRPNFFVGIEERVYICDEADPAREVIIPDISVIQRPEHDVRVVATEDGGTIEVAEPIIMQTLLDEEVREIRLEIRDVASRVVVTVIEIVSPANKVEGSRGRKSYNDKRVEIMNSPCHLVEIDLLRGGKSLLPVTAWDKGDYFVHVSRAGPPGHHRPNGVIWPVRLHQRLPVIPIPLTPDVPEVSLDLQIIVNSAYDRAGYDLAIDYRDEPTSPLRPQPRAWADKLLRSNGLR
jgi:hypothetical protein